MYESVIGLEVHIQPKTKSKMFCSCNAEYFGSQPNTFTCPVCLGLPGALPYPNKVAIENCIKLGLALNCKINEKSKFDRKHYFYPDLPKGYQISQYDLPFCYEGFIEVDTAKDANRIRITRIHLEEDTAKSIHTNSETLIDFNKSGVPLIELVTEPDFRTIDEVLSFAKRLRQIVRYLDISNANMEKGQMRFELNMSLKESGDKELPKYKIEVKNIGSISVLEKVINYEFKRQKDILNSGKTPVQETRGLRDLSGKTFSQRKKEVSEDYRYFPEPDIPPIRISSAMLKEIKSSIIELPLAKKYRFQEEFNLEPSTAEKIVSSTAKANWFEDTIKNVNDKEIIRLFANWFVRDILSIVKAEKTSLNDLKFTGDDFLKIIKKVHTKELSPSLAKQVLAIMYKTGDKPNSIIAERDMSVITDDAKLEKVVNKVLSNNQKVIEDIHKNPNATKYLLGQVMQATKGKADPKKAMGIIESKLN